MSKNSTPENKPLSITAKEFDEKFDAGEDISHYVDWENAVMVAPGELSPGQKLSLVEEMIDELLAHKSSATLLPTEQASMNISVPLWVHFKIIKEAARQRLSREALVQSWLVEKVDTQEAAK